MSKYEFDNISIIRDGKRWFPTMGEIHYSRVPHEYWAEELRKMRAGGVDVVSAYVIWIHHEEIEGSYDWSGDRDLSLFLKTAKDEGMKVLLRIGPWCHGEVRNGGFPDWLLKKEFEPRTNDERYFDVVKKWYGKIYEQAAPFLAHPEDDSTFDNPVIGVQIENEYGHCGGLYDETGEDHMKRLTNLAKETGFTVFLYTATGWGGARTGGLLPVMGGYCDAPWDQRITEIEPSGNYLFTYERNDHNIGSDHGFGYGITFDIDKFPYLTAELGGGLQVTSHRRTVAKAKDIASVALVKLGSGVNLLGYYMYHGGTNPEGKLTTLQESRETGYLNDLPVKNYDFRAPVGEFGQVTETLRELKLLSYFTQDFGSELCDLPALIPEDTATAPADTKTLRYSFRTDGTKGYAFVNDYVRHQVLDSHTIKGLSSPDNKIKFPEISVKNGDFFFMPFGLSFSGANIKTAFVTPFCKLADKTVFYRRESETEKAKCFDFADAESEKLGKEKFIVLTRNDALNAWRSNCERLVITDTNSYSVVNGKGSDVIVGRGKTARFAVYPDFDTIPAGWNKTVAVDKNTALDLNPVLFTCYERETSARTGELNVEKSTAGYKLNLASLVKGIEGDITDCFVKLSYIGESARLYALKNGKRTLVFDHFFMGEDYPWEIGLKRLQKSEYDLSSFELEVTPLKKDASIYIEKWPEFGSADSIAELKSASFEYEWTYTF